MAKTVHSIYSECFRQACESTGDERENRLSLANCAKARKKIQKHNQPPSMHSLFRIGFSEAWETLQSPVVGHSIGNLKGKGWSVLIKNNIILEGICRNWDLLQGLSNHFIWLLQLAYTKSCFKYSSDTRLCSQKCNQIMLKRIFEHFFVQHVKVYHYFDSIIYSCISFYVFFLNRHKN